MQRVAILLLLSIVALTLAAVPITPGVKSFGTAIKNGHLTTLEQVIFDHISPTGGVINEMWFTGGWDGFNQTRIRIYIDNETTPSLDFELYWAHGIGWGNDDVFPGNEIFGKNAHGGGLYNTYRIPFSHAVKVTATLAFNTSNTFWFILRGLENMPVIIGDLQLPSNARLRLYKNLNVTLQPLEYTTLAATDNAGLLFQVFIQATSADLNFLEACVRAYLDNASTPQFLSSGTEDFFLSAFYFNGGQYFTSQAGLTNFYTPQGSPVQLSMYKLFWRDPVVWSDSLKLVWRNMEDSACPNAWPPPSARPLRPDRSDDVLVVCLDLRMVKAGNNKVETNSSQ